MKITGKSPADGNTKDVKTVVLLKYLSNCWRTLEMPLIVCEINLIFTWSIDCVISSATRQTKFAITDTKLYVPMVTLSTEDNTKLLQQLKSGFKRIIHWNQFQSKVTILEPNPYLDYLIGPSFQGVDRLFVLPFENTKIEKYAQGIIFQT